MPTLTVEVTVEIERQIEEEAARRSTSVGDCARRLLEDALKNVASSEPVFERLAAAGRRIPEEELARIPTDAAENHDHYLYGARKKTG